MSPHLKYCLLILTADYMRTMMLFEPRRNLKKTVLSTRIATTVPTITRICFYQFSGDIINSPVWQNIKPCVKAVALQNSLAFID